MIERAIHDVQLQVGEHFLDAGDDSWVQNMTDVRESPPGQQDLGDEGEADSNDRKSSW